MSRKQDKGRLNPYVPEKANRILHLIFIAITLLMVRIWHLTVIDHDMRSAQSLRPTRKKVVESARRATIRDRFNIPLAMNRVQYNVAIQYSRIREIPAISWETTPSGTRIKHYKRQEYIHALSAFLAKELALNAQDIEDLLHSKAALYDQVPFPLQYHLKEGQYYRLKAREREWVGLHTSRISQRYYPMGPVAGDIIGYMGAIEQSQINAIFHEREELKAYLAAVDLQEDAPLPQKVKSPEEAAQRLIDLEDKAYSAQDFVGKTGIERVWEEELRGFQGKQFFYTDAKGHFLKSLHDKEDPLPGRRILLTLSAELQQYAEQLLIRNESLRSARVAKPYLAGEKAIPHKEPWIKGGAIIAMDPHTGEILALASYPRIDPNDFIPSGNSDIDRDKKTRVRASLELESHLGSIWEGKQPLEREIEDPLQGLSKQTQFLTWEIYLQFLLDKGSDVSIALESVSSMKDATRILQQVQSLQERLNEPNLIHLLNRLYASEGHIPFSSRLKGARKEQVEEQLLLYDKEIYQIKKQLDTLLAPLTYTYDKILLLDFLALLCEPQKWNESLLSACGHITLSDYYATQQAFFLLEAYSRNLAKTLFHQGAFATWRKEHFDAYLRQKRLEERHNKRFARPMTDYLKLCEEALFNSFWQEASPSILYAFLHQQPQSHSLISSAYAPYVEALNQERQKSIENKDVRFLQACDSLAKAVVQLSPALQADYFRTFRPFSSLNTPLYGRYLRLRQDKDVQRQKHLAISWYPKCGYGHGRSWCYRQATVQGSIFKLVPAYQALVERYLALKSRLLHRTQLNPLTILDQPHQVKGKWQVGYTEKGESIPQDYKEGRLVRSLNRHIGLIDLMGALETTSNSYFGLLASDHISSPKHLEEAARQFSYGAPTGIDLPGESGGKMPDDLEENQTGLYSFAIGQHTLVVTPLQTAVMLASIGNEGRVLRPHVLHRLAGRQRGVSSNVMQSVNSTKSVEPLVSLMPHVTTIDPQMMRQLLMPQEIRDMLIEGLQKVAHNIRTNSLGALRTIYKTDPSAIRALIASKGNMVGKTSTGESTERLSLELLTGTQTYNHVWFGALFFDPKEPTNIEMGMQSGMGSQANHFGKTDLVVVVYLRFGGLGKEAVPLAAQVAEKWREIQKRHGF